MFVGQMNNTEQKQADKSNEPSEQVKKEEHLYNAWEQRFNDQNKYHDDF